MLVNDFNNWLPLVARTLYLRLDAAFALLKEASLSKEDELYVKIRRLLGTYTTSGGTPVTYDR
ncbi:MAG: hypothetical protein WBB28_18480, partial [Crinalium sp.]